MSPLLVAHVPYDVKGAELGHSHFIRLLALLPDGQTDRQANKLE